MGYSYAMRPALNPVTILLTILGFMLFWPLGLIMLAFIFWGGHSWHWRQRFDGMRQDWARSWGECGPRGYSRGGNSGNSAFDDYREREMRRLDEERRKLDEERREFDGYVRNLRRARDQEEFDRFRRERDERRKSSGGDTIDL